MPRERAEVLIVGAGLAGCSVALELARQGVETLLVDQDALPFHRASLRNEGKIHLGLVYAADPTLATARLQMEGALSFQQSLERWIDFSDNPATVSAPFVYLAARDSVLPPEELERHYGAVEGLYRAALRQHPESSYLGLRPERLFERMGDSEAEQWFEPGSAAAFYRTEERAVDTDLLAQRYRSAIDDEPRVRFVGKRKARCVQRRRDGFEVSGLGPEGPWEASAAQVVNTAWEGRAALDQTLGLPAPEGQLLRLKYRVLVDAGDSSESAPSATMVLGRYGDVVTRPRGPAYLSWYPAGLRGWANALEAPPEWADACQGTPSAATAQEVVEATRRGIETWYPSCAQWPVTQVDAGVIVARGTSDVHDPSSRLHDRSSIGVSSIDGYHSVESGKLTTAPLFALEAAGGVLAWRDRPQAAAR